MRELPEVPNVESVDTIGRVLTPEEQGQVDWWEERERQRREQEEYRTEWVKDEEMLDKQCIKQGERDFRERMVEGEDCETEEQEYGRHLMQDEDSDDWDHSFGVQNTGRAQSGWTWVIRVNTPTASNEHAWTQYSVVALNLTLALEELAYAVNFSVAESVISVRKSDWYAPRDKVVRLEKYSELNKRENW